MTTTPNTPVAPAEPSRLFHENMLLKAQNAGLERLCETTYVAKGADAYNHATDCMEQWQAERVAAGKDPGTTHSLCDGMDWLYARIAELEDAAPAVPAPVASAWMPIETAPKTSRAILVWCPERKNTYQVNWYMERWEHFGGASRPLYEPPTHWQPLPPAPGARAAPVAQLSEPPEGWKLVPAHPTQVMIDAACDIDAKAIVCAANIKRYADAGVPGGDYATAGQIFTEEYKAAIAAAPTTPKGSA